MLSSLEKHTISQPALQRLLRWRSRLESLGQTELTAAAGRRPQLRSGPGGQRTAVPMPLFGKKKAAAEAEAAAAAAADGEGKKKKLTRKEKEKVCCATVLPPALRGRV